MAGASKLADSYDAARRLYAGLMDPSRRRTLRFVVFGAAAAAGIGLWCRRTAAAGGADSGKDTAVVKKPSRKSGPRPNAEFVRQLLPLLRVMVPGPLSKEALLLYAHSLVLMARTFISIYVAKLDGSIVKSIVRKDVRSFLSLLAKWLLVALPATFVNSMIKYFESVLGLAFRNRLVAKAYDMYFENQTYYRVSNMDGRLPNADQCLTEDVAAFSDSVAGLYSDLTKPLLDVVLIGATLVTGAATRGANRRHMLYLAALVTGVMWATGGALRALSPHFGQLTAECARRRGRLRYVHSRLIAHSEEVAFYGGHQTEREHVASAWAALRRHTHRLYKERIGYVMLEQFLMKYIWSALGMVLVAVPVLTARFQSEKDGFADDAGVSERTKGFTFAKALLMNAADAIERLMSSYKKVGELAGYTSRVSDMFRVFDEVGRERYVRPQLEQDGVRRHDKVDVNAMKGVSVVTNNMDDITLENVPIVTPTGDVVVSSLSLKIERGSHLLISGPNGCGKSSLFRVLAGLWPVAGGVVHRPPPAAVFYVPQRPYMTLGTLLEQVIYPDRPGDMRLRGVDDRRVHDILRLVHLEHVVRREGGWTAVRDWADVLSGGEKQRVGLARVFYRRPPFAMLDECTSAVSVDVEAAIYKALQDEGVTLLTVTHRPSLWRWHGRALLFDGAGGWRLEVLTGDDKGGLAEEKAELERQLAGVEGMRARLATLCAALGDDPPTAPAQVDGCDGDEETSVEDEADA